MAKQDILELVLFFLSSPLCKDGMDSFFSCHPKLVHPRLFRWLIDPELRAQRNSVECLKFCNLLPRINIKRHGFLAEDKFSIDTEHVVPS